MDLSMNLGIFQLDVEQVGIHLLQLLAAFVIAFPVAWERERAARSMGLRTFPIVSIAACGYFLACFHIVEGDPGAQARIVQGLMTGIGFIGGGAILKGEDTVRGTATAASIWVTGAIGASVALGRIELAVVLSLATFAVLRGLTRAKEHLEGAEVED